MIHLFTYGSLMFDDVWKRLVKGHYRLDNARLDGYARRCVKHDEYPVIFPANESVEGVVYFDIDDEDIISLDTFEGEYYERKEVELLVNYEKIIAHTYVLKPAYYDIIDPKLWSETLFEKEGIHRFLKEYKGFN